MSVGYEKNGDVTRGHIQLDGALRRGGLTALCGARIALQVIPVPGGGGSLRRTVEGDEPCPRCEAREAARRLGAQFVVCGACEGTGSVMRVDSPATNCMNCGGEGVFQWVLKDGQR